MNGRADFGVTFNTDNREIAEEISIEDNMEGGDDSQNMQVNDPADMDVLIIFTSGWERCLRWD